jgi:hypothetical protein
LKPAIRFLFAFSLATFCASWINAQQLDRPADKCLEHTKAPAKYRVAKQYRTDVRSGLVLFVSTDPVNLQPDKVLALVCALARLHAAEEFLSVYVLDDYRAAKKYNPNGEGNDRRTDLAFRGQYGFTRYPANGLWQEFDWRADPDGPFVHVDLGAPPERH